MEVIALMRFMPKPSRRVKIAMTIAARNERPKEIPNAERCVALMKRPPVLHRIAAPSTSNRGELLIFHFSSDIDHLPICYGREIAHEHQARPRDSPPPNDNWEISNEKWKIQF